MQHKFWNTQPVFTEQSINSGYPIKEYKVEDISLDPIKISNYNWTVIDLNDDIEMNKISEFINNYYVEDTSNTFRLNYETNFLKLILKCEYDDLCIGIKYKGEYLCLITATLINIGIDDKEFRTNMVNFLCIHPKLRGKNIAPILIKEITRRVYLKGNFQAIYTSEKMLSKPIVTVKYYHRILNLDKCIKTGFKDINKKNIKIYEKLYSLSNIKYLYVKLDIHNFNEHIYLCNELNSYMKQFKIYEYFTLDEFKRIFMNDYINSYIVTDINNNKIGFVSYYKQNIKVINNSQDLVTGNLYYYSIEDKYLCDIINDILIISKNNNCDVFNVTNIMKNELFFKKLKFDEGTGISNYYIYNWQTSCILPTEMAINIF